MRPASDKAGAKHPADDKSPQRNCFRRREAGDDQPYSLARSDFINNNVIVGNIRAGPRRKVVIDGDAQISPKPGEDAGNKFSLGEVAGLKKKRTAKRKTTSQRDKPRPPSRFRSKTDPNSRLLSRSRAASPR